MNSYTTTFFKTMFSVITNLQQISTDSSIWKQCRHITFVPQIQIPREKNKDGQSFLKLNIKVINEYNVRLLTASPIAYIVTRIHIFITK